MVNITPIPIYRLVRWNFIVGYSKNIFNVVPVGVTSTVTSSFRPLKNNNQNSYSLLNIRIEYNQYLGFFIHATYTFSSKKYTNIINLKSLFVWTWWSQKLLLLPSRVLKKVNIHFDLQTFYTKWRYFRLHFDKLIFNLDWDNCQYYHCYSFRIQTALYTKKKKVTASLILMLNIG